MRINIPKNYVSYDYHSVLNSFISSLQERQSNNIKCIFLSGSYARGEATDSSDLDVFCVFNVLNSNTLNDVKYSVRNTPVSYENLEINPQCLFMNEFENDNFISWTERAVRILDSVLIFGEDIFGENVSIEELTKIYKKYLADILMSIRHYICVDEPLVKLTHKKIKNYVLKPLMFSLRMERYCTKGVFPLTINELEKSFDGDEKLIVAYFRDESVYDEAINKDHKEVLNFIHDVVLGKLFCS